jgi:hypothetical protein
MSDLLFGWFATFLVGLGVVLMLIIAAVLLPRTMRIRVERFHCPWRHRDVTVRYITADGEHPLAVMSCTALADPMIVTCGAHCIGGQGQPVFAAGEHPAEPVAG